jgi:hypothetical protein
MKPYLSRQKLSKPLFVCVTCSQDFTRGYDARRHNSKHHFKQAKIVSFIEYLIGRANRTLPAPSQRPPRLAAKNQKKILDFGNNNEQKNAENKFTSLQDDATAIISPHGPSRTSTYKSENSRQNEEKDKAPVTIKGPEYGLEINPSLHNKGMSSCCCEDQIRKANIKLHELEALLFAFYGSDCARELIKSIVRHCNESGDYGYMEECLENHRNTILKEYRPIYSK